jgi:FtsP/CotA-like multicopper oxidase with cupredoxin domain
MTHRSSATLAVALSGLISFGPGPATGHARRAPEAIAANDNRQSAGTLKNGVLTVRLEARSGKWYPEGEHGVGVETAAWAEVGRPLENPGPVIRASVGTVVHASIHNALAKPLTVYGFAAARGVKDSIVIAPGATRDAILYRDHS